MSVICQFTLLVDKERIKLVFKGAGIKKILQLFMEEFELLNKRGRIFPCNRGDPFQNGPRGGKIFRTGAAVQFILQRLFDFSFQPGRDIVSMGNIADSGQRFRPGKGTVKRREPGKDLAQDENIVRGGQG